MKCKVVIASATLLLVTNSWAAQDPYYTVTEISVEAEGASYGPYPSAISEDGTLIGTYSMKALLSRDIDIGLPFTFNRSCQYDTIFCELEFYGSDSSDDLSYDNAYQAWRNAQADAADDGYTSYMMANIFSEDTDTQILPFDESSSSTDVKVTDVFIDGSSKYSVGFSSAAYDDSNERDFVRRAFVNNQSSDVILSLRPDFYEETGGDDADDAHGGLSSAYKIKNIIYGDGTEKTLVVGASSISLPEDDDSDDVQEYFDACYFSDEDDEMGTLNELVYCSGFDTQAWAWDVSTALSNTVDETIDGFALASEWLDDNEDNDSSNITYSASALDINASGIAVGVSTFEYSDTAAGGRQRAIIMTPYSDASGDDSFSSDDTVSYDDDGNVSYGVPIELTDASYSGDEGESGEDDSTYNTWAIAVTDGDDGDLSTDENTLVVGNREYSDSKSVNKPTEFFVYDLDEGSISFPLQDQMVLTTEQKNSGESSSNTGANSRAYDINEDGFIVGKADDYDQTHPVYGGMPRSQSGFLYENDSGDSWFINDLICSQADDGTVTSPLYKIRSARVINDDGTVLAEGWKYESDADYQDEVNATEVMLKLTRNTGVSSPDDSPNCWDSDLFDTTENESYERSGAASFWLWILALPLLLVRRFTK